MTDYRSFISHQSFREQSVLPDLFFRKKELEKKEKEHSTEFNALVETLKKEKEKLAKEHAKQAKVTKR